MAKSRSALDLEAWPALDALVWMADAPDLSAWEEVLPVFDAPDLSAWEEVLPVFDAPDLEAWDVPECDAWPDVLPGLSAWWDGLDLSGWEKDPAEDVSANMPSRTQLDGGSDDGSTGPDPDAVTP